MAVTIRVNPATTEVVAWICHAAPATLGRRWIRCQRVFGSLCQRREPPKARAEGHRLQRASGQLSPIFENRAAGDCSLPFRSPD